MKNKKQSLYNKYRPVNFEEVVGQKVIKDILINSIQKNKINHAYLFFGIRGTGKTTLARIFSKAINCRNPIGVEPCNQCDICLSINNGTAFDVIEIDAASNNGVDEIRSLKENAAYLTTHSKYKVYIIDEVHMLTKAAFNALLKILEEPPVNTVFLLATTEMRKIPQTVLSRTIILNLEILSKKDVIKGLKFILEKENIEYDIDSLEYITTVSGGSLRDAISFLETSLLFDDMLSVENIIKSLGLIEKNHLTNLLKNDPSELASEIDISDKNPNKIALLIMDVVINLIKEGMIEYVDFLNKILTSINSFKDPLLLRIALRSALYTIPTIIKDTNIKPSSANVSRETLAPVEKLNDVKQEERSETVVNKKSKKVITDYVDAKNYLAIIKANISKNLEKDKYKWSFLNNYITLDEYKDVAAVLMNTVVLATSEKSIIIGIDKEDQIANFKEISLSAQLFKFIEKILGKPKFVLPVNEESWNKLLIAKDKTIINESYIDVPLNIDNFIKNTKQRNKENIESLFGESNITNE